MSEDSAPFSLAPTRTFVDGRQVDSTPQSWEPPPPTMSRMRLMVNGEEQPFIVRGSEDEEEPAPQTVEALGLAQKQADKEAEWRLLDRRASRPRTDYQGMREDRKLNEDMLRIRRLRNDTGRDLLHPWELKQGPTPRLAVPPPVDCWTDRQR